MCVALNCEAPLGVGRARRALHACYVGFCALSAVGILVK